MATYLWSGLGDAEILAFDPSSDVLQFDDISISAADIVFQPEATVSAPISVGDKTVLLTLSSGTLLTSNFSFSDGSILLVGTSGSNLLSGGAGNDQLAGRLGNDTLIGGAGDDVLDGGFVYDLQSAAGFFDLDTADYSAAPAAITVDLAAGIALDGTGGTDMLSNIERVVGSAFADHLVGSSTVFEILIGGAGNDTIDGGLGSERLDYSAATGSITIQLSNGRVVGNTSVGVDTLIEVDQFVGTHFADIYDARGFAGVTGPNGVLRLINVFDGLGGNDTIHGNGHTRISYSGGSDAVTVNLATGIASGGATVGIDTFTGVNGARGSSLADTLIGGGADEIFEGRNGNDFITGNGGFDLAIYSFDAGAISQGISVDLAVGVVSGDPALSGIDTLRSIESVRGSHRDDVFDATGFSGSSVNAGSSAFLNEFEGMAGSDLVIGNGSTRLSYGEAREGVLVDLSRGVAEGGASVGADSFSGVAHIRGSNFDDTLIGGRGGDTLEGGAGDDTYGLVSVHSKIVDSGGVDTVRPDFSLASLPAGIENATLAQIAGNASLSGATGVNRLAGNSGANLIDGRDGDDTLEGGKGDDTLVGGNGNDVLDGGRGADRMEGGAGNDYFIVSATRDEIVELAGGGTDTVEVHAARYALAANVENIVLARDGGSIVAGNVLANRFVFEEPGGVDTIVGFVPGVDKIVLDAAAFTLGLGAVQYEEGTGALFYDGTQIALLGTDGAHPMLAAGDVQWL